MLKTLVSGGHYNNKLKTVELVTPELGFAGVLFGAIKEQVVDWAIGPTSFVVVALLETQEEFAGVEELKKLLRKGVKKIEKSAAGGNKGSKVVLEKL